MVEEGARRVWESRRSVGVVTGSLQQKQQRRQPRQQQQLSLTMTHLVQTRREAHWLRSSSS
jgi:hypothetical protein